MRTPMMAAGLIATALGCQGQGFVGYHVGNSLTWDGRPMLMDEYAGVTAGQRLAAGHHINCNRSLLQIWDNPEQTCVEAVPEFGVFRPALTQMDLDYITLQPFPAGGATLGSDVQVMTDMYTLLGANPENDETVVYIYQAWGAPAFMSDGRFHAEVPDDPSTPMTFADEYYENLYGRVRTAIDAEVRVIPAGRVINLIAERIAEGEFDGVSSLSAGFYRDPVHMSYDLGRFAASATIASVILNRPPFGMHQVWLAQDLDDTGGSMSPVSTYVAIEHAIWDVISADARTGVSPCLADTNRDGMVSPADFNAWLIAFNNGWTLADQNRDGVVTPADFNAWILNFNANAGGC